MVDFIIQIHQAVGGPGFLILSALFTLVLCFYLMPMTTDWMVNSAAGLAGKHLGRNKRTLVINCSTNNPELFNMLVSFGIGRIGGLANPLGSNLANMYLMFIVAKLYVMAKWVVTGKWEKVKWLFQLLKREKGLWFWHVGMSLIMFLFSSVAYWAMTGVNQFKALDADTPARTPMYLMFGGLACLAGIGVFMFFERKLQKKRPELFEDIDEEDHVPSWLWFWLGTAGLIGCSYLLNSVFLAWSEIYSGVLQGLFGVAVFAGLHYFVGSLVTSLPELKVAVDNYEKITEADLNTALASASYSNMTNLAIGAVGSVIVGIMLLFGYTYQL